MISTAATGRQLRELAEEDALLECELRRTRHDWIARLCRDLREDLRVWVAARIRPQRLGVVRTCQ